MKIVRYTSKEEAQQEAARLADVLGLPDGMIYEEPWQLGDGIWALKVKENGSYPSVGVIQGTVEEWEKTDPEVG